jgi:hypothetical protein
MDIDVVRAPSMVSWGARSQMYGELTGRRAGVDSGRMMTTNDLQAFFGNGWDRHDVDVRMTFMADDSVFESTAGPEVCGRAPRRARAGA